MTSARAAKLAAQGPNIVVIGIKPHARRDRLRVHRSRQSDAEGRSPRSSALLRSPTCESRSSNFVSRGNFFWNSGMFVWGARTLADALSEHLPKTAPLLEEIAASYGTPAFEKTFAPPLSQVREHQHRLRAAGAAFGKGESKSGIYCIPATFGWNDLGSWTALLRTSQCTANDGRPRTSSQPKREFHAERLREFHSLGAEICGRSGREQTWWWWKPPTPC